MGLRKSKTYKGKPHPSHARVKRRKHLLKNKKCKCYLCGEEGHFARDCPNERRNIKRVHYFSQLDLPEDYDIVSVQEGEDVSDTIFSMSEEEGMDDLDHIINPLHYETIYMLRECGKSWWIGPLPVTPPT